MMAANEQNADQIGKLQAKVSQLEGQVKAIQAEIQPGPVCFCGKHGVPCPKHGANGQHLILLRERVTHGMEIGTAIMADDRRYRVTQLNAAFPKHPDCESVVVTVVLGYEPHNAVGS